VLVTLGPGSIHLFVANNFFSFIELVFGEVSVVPQKVRNIGSRVGFHFAVMTTFNAQNQLHHHVRTENDSFRYGRKS
jgi:hypothetical protein